MMIVGELLLLFISIVLHEIAHGYAALMLGDDTAYRYGRLSLNPLHHIDKVGSLALPLLLYISGCPFLFGWAKPVPVNFGRLRNKSRDTVIVASAGIIVNLALALLGWLGLRLFIDCEWVVIWSIRLLAINIALIIFNIIPIPPLDGSKIFFGWINRPWARRYVASEREGLMFIVIFILSAQVLDNILGHSLFDFINPSHLCMQILYQLLLLAGVQ